MLYEMWGTINGINNAREILNSDSVKDKFVAILGNHDWGEVYNTKEDLIKGWKRCLAMSYNQDLYLYHNGNLVRSVINFNKKITNKFDKCFYKKHLVKTK